MMKKEYEHTMMNFRSQRHQVFTLKETSNVADDLIFADIECCIDDHRKFTSNLICFERENPLKRK